MVTQINKKYFRKAKRIANLLNLLPFVRCVILNGSVAKGLASKSSDIDLLIVAKEGRIFTCRFLAVSLVTILGMKRPRNENASHSGKFCLNYFMTDKHLTIPHQREESINNYCASNYSHSCFLAGDSRIFKHFIYCNKNWWLKYGFETKIIEYRLTRWTNFLKVIFENLLSDSLEEKFKKFQLSKIERDNLTILYPELVVCSDFELRFHPPKTKCS